MHIKVSKSPRLKFTAHLIISSLVSMHLACKVIISVFHKICKENEFKINKQVSFAGNYSFAQNVFLRKMIQIMQFLEIHQCFKTFLSILFLLFCDVLKIIFRLYVRSRIHYQRFWFTFSYIQAISKEILKKKCMPKIDFEDFCLSKVGIPDRNLLLCQLHTGDLSLSWTPLAYLHK